MASESTTRPLPGGQRLPREFIALHQRARIIAALAEEVSEQGYQETTIADVVRRAGIARNTFYENFGSKADCFLAAQEHAISAALERFAEATEACPEWPQKVRAGLTALIACVEAEPALARTCLVEALAAGPTPVKRYEESRETFVSLLRLGRGVSSHGKDLPETLEEAVAGGVFWILYECLTTSPEALPELLPELVEFALTPYMGTERARETALGAEVEVKKLAS